MNGRVLLNLESDGNAKAYVVLEGMGAPEKAVYEGTWTMEENTDHDDELTLSYKYNDKESAQIDKAVIIDSQFQSVFYMIASMTSDPLEFYEISPVTVGDGTACAFGLNGFCLPLVVSGIENPFFDAPGRGRNTEIAEEEMGRRVMEYEEKNNRNCCDSSVSGMFMRSIFAERNESK